MMMIMMGREEGRTNFNGWKQELESLSTKTGGCESNRMEARTQEERIRHKMKGRKYVLAFVCLYEGRGPIFGLDPRKFSLGQSYQNESERKSEVLSSSSHHLPFLVTPSISILLSSLFLLFSNSVISLPTFHVLFPSSHFLSSLCILSSPSIRMSSVCHSMVIT